MLHGYINIQFPKVKTEMCRLRTVEASMSLVSYSALLALHFQLKYSQRYEMMLSSFMAT